jgi:hypothetical protein
MTPRAAAKRTAAKPGANSFALDAVFDDLKAILVRYAPSFTVREGYVRDKRDYHLIIKKPQVINGRQRDETWFASVIQQRNNVGLYLTACSGANLLAQLSPELLKHLDGKSCFHMKTLTPGLKKDVDAALKLGIAAYKKQGWL